MPATAGKFGSKDSLTPSGQEKVGATEEQKEAAELQMEISKNLYESTRGLRKEGIGQLERFLETGRAPQTIMPAFDLLYRQGREGLEEQFQNARQQILNETPGRGGQLNDQLRDLAVDRAQAVGGLRTSVEAPLRQQLFQAALGVGFNQPPIALSGINMAASQQGAIASRSQAEQLEREARAKEEWQNIGSMMGGMMT